MVTPEIVANKINNMKENKSPVVDGIAPKILKETVKQMCTPLAHVFKVGILYTPKNVTFREKKCYLDFYI